MTVRNIIETKNGYSHVVIDRQTFGEVVGFRPKREYTTTRNAQGHGVRVYNIDGVKLLSRLNKETGKHIFVLKAEDAARLLESEEDVVEFDF